MRNRREKTFGLGPAEPHDKAWKGQAWRALHAYNRAHKQPGQHVGPITRAYQDVYFALLYRFGWGEGRIYPAYETIAEAARCSARTVARAIVVLETAGLLTWVHRLVRKGARVLRRSNAYRLLRPIISKCQNGGGPEKPIKNNYIRDTSRTGFDPLKAVWTVPLQPNFRPVGQFLKKIISTEGE
jgi:hypothetical protein